MDNLRHKDELKVQMLKNDISAAAQTLHDSEQLLVKHMNRLSHIRAGLNLVTVNETMAIKKLRSAQSEYQVIDTQVERLKRERMDAQTILINAQHDRNEIKQRVEHVKQAIEGDEIELTEANRTLQTFETGVLAGLKSHIRSLHGDKFNTSKLLNETRNEIRRLHTMNESIKTKSISQDSAKSLRDTLRESKLFLAKQGYKDPISLLQSMAPDTLGADVDTDLRLFRQTSKELALEKRLQDIDSDEMASEGELQQSLLREKGFQNRVAMLVSRENSDKKSLSLELSKLNVSQSQLIMVEGHVATLESDLTKRVAEEGKLKAAVDAEEREARVFSDKAKALNNTLESVLTAVEEARLDKETHSSDVKHIRDDINISEAEIRVLYSNLTRVSSLLKNDQDTLTELNERLLNLSKQAERQERLHTEYMADVAQIGRRIEEKADAITELESSQKSEQASIELLESQIRDRLDKLKGLNEKLREETGVSNSFSRRIVEIKNDLGRMRCKI
jgi:chromosome segregation ATPase